MFRSKLESYLQKQLDTLYDYCPLWKLKVRKSKVVFFFGMSKNLSLMYNDASLDAAYSFECLGILLSKTGSFSKAKKGKHRKGMYYILRILYII